MECVCLAACDSSHPLLACLQRKEAELAANGGPEQQDAQRGVSAEDGLRHLLLTVHADVLYRRAPAYKPVTLPPAADCVHIICATAASTCQATWQLLLQS